MPKFVPGKERTREPAGTAGVARTERKAQPRAHARARENPPERTEEAADRGPGTVAMHEQVIADAARLVQWGRKWYELAELISGMANRPSLIDVRRILKDNKSLIDKKAGRS